MTRGQVQCHILEKNVTLYLSPCHILKQRLRTDLFLQSDQYEDNEGIHVAFVAQNPIKAGDGFYDPDEEGLGACPFNYYLSDEDEDENTIPAKLKTINLSNFDISSLNKEDIGGLNSIFAYDDTLTSVTWPSSIGNISDIDTTMMFYYCSSLTSASIPDCITTIGECAFDGCESLASITIPDSVTEICIKAFNGCKSLKTVTFETGSELTTIDEYAFWTCTSLETVNFSGTKADWKDITFVCEATGNAPYKKSDTQYWYNHFYAEFAGDLAINDAGPSEAVAVACSDGTLKSITQGNCMGNNTPMYDWVDAD